MTSFTIGQLAAEGGVGVETIRYYQRRGLLNVPHSADSSAYGRKVRRYGPDDFKRLTFIRSAQAAGFTLSQIEELISLDSTDDRARARTIAQDRIHALDQQIAQLQASREALQSLATECARGKKGPCPILTTFEAECDGRAPAN